MATASKAKARVATAAHDEKRHEIIMHCANLFDKVGYHGTTMQMLADEAGLGKPTLYHYFASKADILFEMHQLHIDAMIGGLELPADQGADPGVALTRACASTLREIAQHPGYVRAFMEHYGELEGDHRTEIRKRRQQYFDRICDVIQSGIASGKFRKADPMIATLAFLGMCNWAYKWYPPKAGKTPPEKMAKLLCRVFLEGLSSPGDAEKDAAA
jgi:AcrR family transcriptional regulator